MPAVSFRHDRRQIIIPIAILPPQPDAQHFTRLRGLIDTGASASGVPAAVAGELGLPRRGKTVITTPAGESITTTHLFRVGFYPSEDSPYPYVLDEAVLGIVCSPGSDFDVLIGMDILGAGDLVIRRDGTGSFTFG